MKSRNLEIDPLRFDLQTCFPLYAASRLLTRLYQPLLLPLDLTYPQYLVMLLLWEHKSMTVSRLGKETYLESSTMSPLLKKLETKGLVIRSRSREDERVVSVVLTSSGAKLRHKAKEIPLVMFQRIGFPASKTVQLKMLLDELTRLLSSLQGQNDCLFISHLKGQEVTDGDTT